MNIILLFDSNNGYNYFLKEAHIYFLVRRYSRILTEFSGIEIKGDGKGTNSRNFDFEEQPRCGRCVFLGKRKWKRRGNVTNRREREENRAGVE